MENVKRFKELLERKEAISEVMHITPELAREMLAYNYSNRPISKNTVRKYINAMQHGEWLLNGQSIIFSLNERLIDGQHRLKAIVDSGISIDSFVSFGMNDDSFITIDKGRCRNLSQNFASDGVLYYTIAAQCVKTRFALLNSNIMIDNKCNNFTDSYNCKKAVSDSQFYDFYYSFNYRIDSICKYVNDLITENGTFIITKGNIAGIMLYLIIDKHYDYNTVYEFFSELLSLETSKYPVIEKSRRKCLKIKKDSSNFKKTLYRLNLVIATWNKWVLNDDRDINVRTSNLLNFVDADKLTRCD